MCEPFRENEQKEFLEQYWASPLSCQFHPLSCEKNYLPLIKGGREKQVTIIKEGSLGIGLIRLFFNWNWHFLPENMDLSKLNQRANLPFPVREYRIASCFRLKNTRGYWKTWQESNQRSMITNRSQWIWEVQGGEAPCGEVAGYNAVPAVSCSLMMD